MKRLLRLEFSPWMFGLLLAGSVSGQASGTVTNCLEADLRIALIGGGSVTLACDSSILLVSPIIVEHIGIPVNLLQFQPTELILIPALIVLASVVGYLPAVAAYRTDVARWLMSAP